MKLLLRILDMLIAFSLITIYLTFFILISLKPVKLKLPNLKEKKSIMRLNPTCCKIIKEKGIIDHLYDLNEDNYFKRFYEVHTFCEKYNKIDIKNNITIIEYPRFSFNSLNSLGLKYTNYLLTEIKITIHTLNFVKNNEIDVVKSQEPYLNGMRALIIKKILGIPYVEDIVCNYDLIYNSTGNTVFSIFKFRKLEKIIERIVFRNADLVQCGTVDISKYVIDNGAEPSRIFFLRDHGLSHIHFLSLDKRINLKEELGLSSYKVMLYCGRLHKEKYVEDVIKCYDIVSKKMKNTALVIVGEGPQKNELESMVKENKLINVFFLGFKSQEYMCNLFYSADIILCPLSGSVLIEAALSGTPIVAYDVDWHNELIKNKETGIVVKCRDYISFANSTFDILNNKNTEYGKRARELALKKFDITNSLELRRKMFEKLFKGE